MKLDWSFLDQFMKKVDRIIFLLDLIFKENKKMTLQMDALIEAVAAENTVIDGVITLIEGFNSRLDAINQQLAQIEAELTAAQADTAALQAVNAEAVTLHDEVEAKTVALANAAATVPPV